MEAKITTSSPDIVAVTSSDRPTPTPVRTSFSEVMARSAGTVVGGAESAMTTLPGTSMMAVALRGGVAGATPAAGMPGAAGVGLSLPMGLPGGAGIAEGPGGGAPSAATQFYAAVNGAAAGGDGGAAASLQQSQQSNLYYLQLQQQVNQQSQTFEALSNVMKSESDTVKNAIGNMH